MDEDEIKTLRHSFTSKEDAGKVKKNQFGHTVLGKSQDLDISKTQVEINNLGEVEANYTESILTNPAFLSLINALEKKETNFSDQNNQVSDFKPNSVNLADLLNELDEMDGTSKKKLESSSDSSNQSIDHMKSCLNKDCLYCLPKEAKFCLKCGTAQMPKFCTECGFSFPSMEKFCPDCGKKR
jgi:hypothetical protein